jgi:Na+(H+)/acetate symporter ActP
LSGRRLRQTCALVVVANWANWLLTLVGALLGVNGLAYTGQRANDGLAFALQAAVVLPALVGSVAWTYGLLRKERS